MSRNVPALALMVLLPLASSPASIAQVAPPALPAAASVPGAAIPTMWDLSDLYRTPQDWNAAYERTRAGAAGLERYRGTLGQDATALFGALSAISAVHREADRLSTYAQLKADEDTRVASAEERQQQALALTTLISEKTAWVKPEIIALGAERLRALVLA